MCNALRHGGMSILVIFSLLAFSGCGTTTPYKAFDDMSLNEDQYAVIDCITKNKSTQEMEDQGKKPLIHLIEETPYCDAFIFRIDGKMISFLGKSYVHVLPGKHTLNIGCRKSCDSSGQVMTAFADRWLIAEAGKKYYVIARQTDEDRYRVHIVLVDENNNLVGGIVGSDDEPDVEIKNEAKP